MANKVVSLNDLLQNPDTYKERMAKMQINIFNSAVKGILRDAGKALLNQDNDTEVFMLRALFDLEGNKIVNLLEVHLHHKVLVASDRTYFRGISSRQYPGLFKP